MAKTPSKREEPKPEIQTEAPPPRPVTKAEAPIPKATPTPTKMMFTAGIAIDTDGNVWQSQSAGRMVLLGTVTPPEVGP